MIRYSKYQKLNQLWLNTWSPKQLTMGFHIWKIMNKIQHQRHQFSAHLPLTISKWRHEYAWAMTDVSLPGLPSAILFKRAQSSGRKAIPLFLITSLVHFALRFGSSLFTVASVVKIIWTPCAAASSVKRYNKGLYTILQLLSGIVNIPTCILH